MTLLLKNDRPPTVEDDAPNMRRSKWIAVCLLTVCVATPYYLFERLVFRPVFNMPVWPLDRAIPFQPGAIWLYQSVYLLLSIPAILITRREDVWRYAAGIFLIGLVANSIFLLFPTQIERPIPPDANWLYALTIHADLRLNACPSLHAAWVIFAGLWTNRLRFPRPPALRAAALLLWSSAILYATIATRQHVLLDLIAGGLLGGILFFLSIRLRVDGILSRNV